MNTKLLRGIAAFIRRNGRVRATGLGVVLFALIISGCDSSGGAVATDGLNDRNGTFALLTADLGLTEADATAIASKMSGVDAASVDAPDPGFMWELAAQIHASLSQEQLETLMERIRSAGAMRPGAMRPGAMRPGAGAQGGRLQGGRPDGAQGFGPDGPGGVGLQRFGVKRALSMLELTDAQKEEIRAIHEARRVDVRALLADRGTVDREEFREQMNALREDIQADVKAVLTEEQIDRLEAFREEAKERRVEREAARETRREEARAAMADVLGLTDDQVSALDALRSEQDNRRSAVRELVDGGADRDDVRAFLEAERTAHQEAVMEIVDERQYEIMQIHGFLAGRFAARRAAGVQDVRPGGPGGPDIRRGGGPGQRG